MRKNRILNIFLLLFFLQGYIYGHSGKANIHVIIDTDCGADDLRAISLILSSPAINVHGFITSDGALSPDEGTKKLEYLLSQYHHEGLPISRGYNNLNTPPPFRAVCSGLSWGDSNYYKNKIMDPELLITETGDREKIQFSYICLGSLYNISKLLANNKNKLYINKIIWYNGKSGTNHNFCNTCFNNVKQSGIKITMVSGNDFEISPQLIDKISNIESAYAENIVKSVTYLKKTHDKVMVWDDFIPFFLLYPQNFTDKNGTFFYKGSEDEFETQYTLLLKNNNKDASKVFAEFPVDTSLFAKDVSPFIKEIIHNNGINEWRAGVITNELHGHLGIYAIIGTKMGIRVREYYRTGVDDIKIESYAGKIPPVSCMNDGLQVSTGATVGHGLISVISDDKTKKPAAMFYFRGQCIEVCLKKEYSEKIKNDVIKGVSTYGTDSDQYWQYIRDLAILYWKEMDRHDIFNIENIEP